MNMGSNTEFTFTATSCYINKELLYRMAYGCHDENGLEYPYNLFDLAQDPLIIQKIMEGVR